MNFKKRVNGSWTDIPNYIHKASTDIITTLPAIIHPTSTTATVGLKGQAVQSGTPTPDNPIMPEGTGDKTGNLFDYKTVTVGKYINASGQEVTSSGSGEDALNHSDYIPIVAGTTYTFKCSKAVNYTGATNAFCWFDSSKQLISRDLFDGENGSNTILGIATAPTGAAYLIMNYRGLHGNTAMLNSGSTPLPYEPYGIKIPISSANIATPVYLGEVETTRKIRKLVLTGDENWSGSSKFRIGLSGQIGTIAPICTHYRGVTTSSYGDLADGRITVNGGIGLTLAICDIVNQSSLTAWKSYLAAQYAAGTPVTVWYVLATEQTGIVNEPLMKIGDYADTVSDITIPVTAGGDTISIDTTVQPSEVTVNYKGWHDTTVKQFNGTTWE